MLRINGLGDILAVESGYEEGCKWGARLQSANSGGSWFTRDPVGMTRRVYPFRVLPISVSCSTSFNSTTYTATPFRRFEDSSGRYPSKAGQFVTDKAFQVALAGMDKRTTLVSWVSLNKGAEHDFRRSLGSRFSLHGICRRPGQSWPVSP